MPIFGSSVSLPILVRIEEKLLNKVCSLLRNSNLLFTNPLIITMRETRFIAEKATSGFKRPYQLEITDNSYATVEKVEDVIDDKHPDVLIGVGGGRVIDVAKFAGSRRMLPVVSVPTSLSNDGISSPVAVILFRKGTRSVGVNMPTAVLVDLTTITTAPLRNLKAGVGDLLSNISATNDWLLAHRKTREHYDAVAALLARKPACELLSVRKADFADTAFLRVLAEGLVLSGIAMGIAGTSRPCSGAEHLLSHAYDELFPTKKTLHGEQVAIFGVLTSLLQTESSWREQKDFLKKTGLLSTPSELDMDFKKFKKVLEIAPSTRPGRYTVLDEVDEKKIEEAYCMAYGE